MQTLIVKSTDGCNLNCCYCSVGDKKKTSNISREVLFSTMDFVSDVCRYRDDKNLTVIFHGGEPTLIPVDYYIDSLTYFCEKNPDINISVSFQTNGFHISEEMISFWKDWNVHVGVSVDGSRDIHNRQRMTFDGKPSFDTVMNNTLRLCNDGIDVSLLMVLTKNAVFSDYSFLNTFSEHHLSLKVNPLLRYGNAKSCPELFLDKGDYADFLIGMYEYILVNDLHMVVHPINEILNCFLRKQDRIRGCTFSDNCFSRFIAVDFSGNVFPCGRFADLNQLHLGTIYGDVKTTLGFCDFKENILKGSSECSECKYLSVCHSGCPGERSICGSLYSKSPLCDDYYRLFSYFEVEGLKKLKRALLKKRESIMKELKRIGL